MNFQDVLPKDRAISFSEKKARFRGFLCLAFMLLLTACVSSTQDRIPMSWNPDLRDVEEESAQIMALKTKAAQEPSAAYDLALRYFRGDGVRRNNHQALTWMREAAEKGELAAQKALGALYLTGLETVGRDPNEAHAWLSLAASRGDSESQKLLAEAEAAKRSNEYAFMVRRWHPWVYRWWWHGYPYYYRWNGRWWYY